MFKRWSISVAMPALNEEFGVGETVSGFVNHPYVDEVVVADNNSSDGTAEVARAAGAVVLRECRRGYGFACRSALDAATGDLLVLTESDNSFYPEDLDILLAYIPYFDIVKGARSNYHLIDKSADWTYGLLLGNWALAKYMQVLYTWRRSIEDISLREVGGTYRVIRRDAWLKIRPFIREGKSAFLPDMVTVALRRKLSLLEVPVRYRGRIGESKITGNRIRATLLALRMFRIITENRFRRIPS